MFEVVASFLIGAVVLVLIMLAFYVIIELPPDWFWEYIFLITVSIFTVCAFIVCTFLLGSAVLQLLS